MLRDIYAPTDFESVNADPSVSTADKLQIISQSPVAVEHEVVGGRTLDDSFHVSLPFVYGGTFFTYADRRLFCTNITLGDEELYQNGIGTRIVKSAVRYAVELKRDPEIEVFTTGWARLGLVNTAVAVFGQENVAVKIDGEHFKDRYGWQGNKSLDEVFDDKPPEEGRRYLVYCVEAAIDRDQAMSWELPVVKKPQTDHSV